MYRERSSIGFKCSSKMSWASSTISRWLLATNFVSSFKVFMKEWPRRSRVILTSPSVFVLLSFCRQTRKNLQFFALPLPPLMKPICGEITKLNCQTHNRALLWQFHIVISRQIGSRANFMLYDCQVIENIDFVLSQSVGKGPGYYLYLLGICP